MKRAVVPCAVLALLLFDSGVRADSCDVKLTDGSVAVWQGPCREGTPYGKGEVTHNGKTYKAVVEDRQDGLVQFSLDDDGRPAAPRVGGRHRDGNEPQRQAAGQDPRDSSAGSALAGGREENRPAEDTGAGAPPASAGARENFGFREYNAIGGDAESRDRGEPVEDEDAEAPPASTAARSPEPPAPGDAVTEQPAEAETAAAPCKLEVAGELLDWSGSCDGDGRASGDGNATAPDGTTYEGSAQNGQRHGFGTATTPAGNYYQGWFRNGVKHGKGVIRAADGEYYRTQFENGVEGRQTDARGVCDPRRQRTEPWGGPRLPSRRSGNRPVERHRRRRAGRPLGPGHGNGRFRRGGERRAWERRGRSVLCRRPGQDHRRPGARRGGGGRIYRRGRDAGAARGRPARSCPARS